MGLQLFAGTLGQELGRSATVAVDRVNTAQIQHDLAHFVAVQAGGIGSLTAVVHNRDDGTVSLHAQHGTGSAAAGMILRSGDQAAVLDQEAKVGRDDLLFPAGDLIGSRADDYLGHIRRTGLAVLLVEVDDQAGLRAAGLALAVGVLHAVQDHIAQRLTYQLGVLCVIVRIIPAQADIHSGNYIAVAVGLGIGCLGVHSLHAVVAGSGDHALGAGDNLGIGVIHVHLNHMEHLPAVRGIVVQNDLRLGNAGCQLPVLLGDHLVIIACRSSAVLRRRCREGHGAEQHHRTQCERYQTICFLFHYPKLLS